ncbi:MAG: hypothetical protein HY207_06825 [Nitrospirae bacterium]|nr:hypothetical protein [Nitrospirota bacterium]
MSVGSAWAESASLSIVSPQDGAVFEAADVPIETRFVKGPSGDHLHVYVDGAFYKSAKRESLTVWDLRDGEHLIELRAASREKDEKGVEHKELGINARVKVTVATKQAKRALSSKPVVR